MIRFAEEWRSRYATALARAVAVRGRIWSDSFRVTAARRVELGPLPDDDDSAPVSRWKQRAGMVFKWAWRLGSLWRLLGDLPPLSRRQARECET